jgi:hypothetical protein
MSKRTLLIVYGCLVLALAIDAVVAFTVPGALTGGAIAAFVIVVITHVTIWVTAGITKRRELESIGRRVAEQEAQGSPPSESDGR